MPLLPSQVDARPDRKWSNRPVLVPVALHANMSYLAMAADAIRRFNESGEQLGEFEIRTF
jgi:hypothetical protein